MTQERLKEILPNLPSTVKYDSKSLADFIFWNTFETGLRSAFAVVEKAWGAELHIVNNDKYCMKYLMMWRGGRLGRHFHKIKHETFFIVGGNVEATVGDKVSHLSDGHKLEIPIGAEHTLLAYRNTAILEVSTHDYVDDSYRLEPYSNYDPTI